MSSVILYFVIFVFSAVITKLCFWAYCPLAVKFGLLDKPDANRKLHKKSVPVGGGIVIFVVTFVAILVLGLLLQSRVRYPLLAGNMLIPLFSAATLLVVVGLIDDKKGMNGKKKLLFQVIAASIVIFFAGAYSKVALFGVTFNLGHLFYPLGIIWLVGMINSVNLLDGVDGVATTTGFLMSVTAGIIAFMNGYLVLFVVALVFSGTLLGFFSCNRPPAKVYLGDTGSMLIGFFVAVLLLRACVTDDYAIQAIPPFAVGLIPILDSCFAVFRRKNSGRSIFAPDRGHIHHRLQNKVGVGYRLLGILVLLILPGCLGAIAGVYWNNDWIPLVTVVGTIGVAAYTKLFGHEELSLFYHRVANRFRKRIRHKDYEKSGEVFHFQGNGPWQPLWEDLILSLRKIDCVKAHLDISMPFLHEDFSSDWENMDLRNKEEIYVKCTLPLVCNKQQVGKLKVLINTQEISNYTALNEAYELSEMCTRYIEDHVRLYQRQKTLHTKPHFTDLEKQPLEKSSV